MFFDFHIYQNEILNMNLILIINSIKFLNTNFILILETEIGKELLNNFNR